MRELIQPALKIMARTGLFLSVVAWVVGQWWQGLGAAIVAVGVLDQTGIAIVIPWPTTWEWGAGEVPGRRMAEEFIHLQAVPSGAWYFSLPPVAFYLGGTGAGFGIKHYLIVSTFTIFNVALWWYYRQPKEVTPCES